ncbi:MAG TPA: YggT family protein [Gammaproteobacteria bacterium]|jgi:YggT family protein|nr:YggT family protein [Gammaproteobacteria bacterium]
MSALTQGLLFLINTLFDLFLFVLVIRVILAWSGANYFDPITQFIVRMSDFIVKPLRRILPNVKQIEIATLTLIFALELVKFSSIAFLSVGTPQIMGLMVLSLADMIKLFIQTFFYAILVQALMSWVQPNSPMNNVLYQITAPLIRPFQRIIPLIGGMDISPIPAMILLQLLLITLITPLMSFGLSLTFG